MSVETILDDHGAMSIQEMLMLLRGDPIGRGEHRKVYGCPILPGCVVKLEYGESSFANAMEWTMWQKFKGTRWEKWLAPCRFISPCGVVLIMDRAQPLPVHRRPKLVPSFLTDLKLDNWGLIECHPVCLDYGLTHVFQLVADMRR